MSNEHPEPTELDDKRLEQATGGLVAKVVTYQSAKPALQARALNLQGGGGSVVPLDTGIYPDDDDPGVL